MGLPLLVAPSESDSCHRQGSNDPCANSRSPIRRLHDDARQRQAQHLRELIIRRFRSQLPPQPEASLCEPQTRAEVLNRLTSVPPPQRTSQRVESVDAGLPRDEYRNVVIDAHSPTARSPTPPQHFEESDSVTSWRPLNSRQGRLQSRRQRPIPPAVAARFDRSPEGRQVGRGRESRDRHHHLPDHLDIASISSLLNTARHERQERQRHESASVSSMALRFAAHRRRSGAHSLPNSSYHLGSHDVRGPPHAFIDGLGDRNRSLSPAGNWDVLVRTLTPDPQPTSLGSSSSMTNSQSTISTMDTWTSFSAPNTTLQPVLEADNYSSCDDSDNDFSDGLFVSQGIDPNLLPESRLQHSILGQAADVAQTTNHQYEQVSEGNVGAGELYGLENEMTTRAAQNLSLDEMAAHSQQNLEEVESGADTPGLEDSGDQEDQVYQESQEDLEAPGDLEDQEDQEDPDIEEYEEFEEYEEWLEGQGPNHGAFYLPIPTLPAIDMLQESDSDDDAAIERSGEHGANRSTNSHEWRFNSASGSGDEWVGMQHIVRNLARREDIPDEWWAEAGLSRLLPP